MKKQTLEHLQVIGERLRNGNASVFVGAGFSKNAVLAPGGTMPPDWNELGNLFFAKTRGKGPTKSDLAYASVLRLAEDVENVCGRDELTKLIRASVNNENILPSEAHVRLLALPWNDVYTTNYDTLLERAADRLNQQGKRIYSVVANDPSLGVESHPFLVKLHGDINVPDSIVITEEDYRTYPSKHPALINQIQHAIMSDTIVLIGFSGNDPNFIQWLGWVRDALKNNQRKVYLLSVSNISDAAKKTFEKRNVIVVDLRGIACNAAGPSQIILAALAFWEDYLQKAINERNSFRKEASNWGKGTDRDADIESLFEKWKKDRETYPGWLVLPREKREYWASLNGFYLSRDKLAHLSLENQLLFLDEFNWRIEKCLYPIDNNWESIYLSVLNQFKPFSRRCKNEVRLSWVNLKLGLLRFYRQEGWTYKWQAARDELNVFKKKFPEDQRCRFDYEQALQAIYRNDFVLLEEVLNEWQECASDPYWDIRRGALWAEYLCLEKGKEIALQALQLISKRLDESESEKERFYWASRKVHAYTAYNCMAKANFSEGEHEAEAARQTWSELKSYDDIWYEREFFDSTVRNIEDALSVETKVASFQLGRSRTTTNLSGNAKDYRVAYAYFLYYEETGFPIHLPFLISINKTTLEKALSVMGYSSLPVAACWLLRSGDSKLVPAVFNRRFLNRTKREDVNQLYNRYLGCWDNLIQATADGKSTPWMLVYRSVLPEILSRLCMKACYDLRVKTWDRLEYVFQNKDSIHYEGLDRLISSLVSSFSKSELKALIPKLASLPIAIDRFGDARLEPLYYVHEPVRLNIDSFKGVVDDLLEKMGTDENEDKVVIYRLLFLNECAVLSRSQQEKLAYFLWSKVDSLGFPQRTVFNRFAFLNFPHPKEVNPEILLKNYFSKTDLPVVGLGKSVSFYGGTAPILNELKGTMNSDIPFVWDAHLLNDVCTKLITMWDSDKPRLLKEEKRAFGVSIKDELQGRFDDVEVIISGVIASNLALVNEQNKQGLRRLAGEFERYGIPSFRMRVALESILDPVVDVDKEIRIRLGSSDDRMVADCIKAIIYLKKEGKDVTGPVEAVSEYFRGNVEQGRIPVIEGLDYFLQSSGIELNDSIRENLMIGLKRLFADSKIEVTDNELNANNKMHLRKLAAPIVHRLLQEVPDDSGHVLHDWKNYYESEETCWDIKNCFLDA